MAAEVFGPIRPTQPPSSLGPTRFNPGTPKETLDVSTAPPTGAAIEQPTNTDLELQTEFSALKSFEAVVPIRLLANEVLLHAEWAWRRLLASELSAQPGAETLQTGLAQTNGAISAMWQTLDHLCDDTFSQSGWSTPWPVSDSREVIPFSALNESILSHHYSKKVQKWVLGDRLIGAVQLANQPISGGGVFVPAPLKMQQEQTEAVRWQAERMTQVSSEGKLVHQLVIRIEVDKQPMEITLLCSDPSLTVHMNTNDDALRDRLLTHAADLGRNIEAVGWHMNGYSIAALDSNKEPN